MKTIFLFLISIFSLKISNSQSLPEFAPIGATWYYHNGTSITGNDFNYSQFYCLDTATILGRLSKHIVGNNFFSGDYYFYSDSLHLYYYYSLGNNWTILADFGKQIGDSFYVKVMPDSFAVHIYDKGDTNINGYILKYIYVYTINTSPSSWFYGGKIIQNIMSEICPIPLYGAIDPGPGPLRCYIDTVIGTYKNPNFHNGSWSCDTVTTGIDFINSLKKTNIFPNPISNSIDIRGYSLLATEIEISDILGRRLLMQHITSPSTQTTVNLRELSAGIYFIIVRDSDGNVEVKKLVKEK